MLMSLLSGCASEPRIVKVIESDCNVVPYINVSDKQIDLLLDNDGLHSLLIEIDKQSRIIDGCKNETR